jgi:lysophospholipase
MPFEFGSWDPGLSAMLPLQFAGAYLMNDLPGNTSAYVTGFDQASFVMVTNSSFFNVCHVIQESLQSQPDLLLQAGLNDTNGSFGFDTENGEEDGMSFLFN